MDTLPQELIEKIIDSIDIFKPYGHSTLLACSRVCRSWRRQSQKKLFTRIQFGSEEGLRRWDRRTSLNSQLPSFVRHLHWSIWPISSRERMDPFFERTLPGRFASFSNLETLRMSALSLRAFDNAAVEHTFGHIGHSLRTLSISDFTTDPEKFLFLISLLPNLRRIKIIAVNLLSGEGRPESNRQHSFNFTGHITSYRRGTEGFFRYIAGLHPRFESLQASMITHSLVDTFNLVVRSCSETLATISITPMSHELEVGAISQLDLSPCYNLRALKVDPRVADLTEFNTLLQTISSVHFEKLVMGPIVSGLPEETKATDQAFCSLAERLYKLGAKKPLKMVLELSPETQEIYETSDIQRAWPLFCEVGVVVEEYGFGL